MAYPSTRSEIETVRRLHHEANALHDQLCIRFERALARYGHDCPHVTHLDVLAKRAFARCSRRWAAVQTAPLLHSVA
jgi:hypothetical protein